MKLALQGTTGMLMLNLIDELDNLTSLGSRLLKWR